MFTTYCLKNVMSKYSHEYPTKLLNGGKAFLCQCTRVYSPAKVLVLVLPVGKLSRSFKNPNIHTHDFEKKQK